jgi:Signal transduction histidine kinase
MKLSFGNKVFLSIAAAFAVIIIAVLTYLRFDDLLMSTLKEDLIFKWFGIGLFVFLVVFLLLYSNKVDRDFKEDSSRKHTEISRQLTQNISHELKTPVASIKGYLETILENPDMPEETRIGFLSRCLSQTQRLTSLLDDLSLLNRMGDTEDIDALFPMHPIDVMDTITQLSKEKAQVLQSKGMSLRTGLPSKIDLNGNESLIYSIFRNLLDNAIMYAGDGAVISLSAYREGSSWHFTFADNGPGVDKEHLDHLFDRFYRVDKSRSRASGGTGLGLTIVRNAVRRHGGTIAASSNDPGLRFDFTLRR